MDVIFENRNTISNFDCSYGEKTFAWKSSFRQWTRNYNSESEEVVRLSVAEISSHIC